MLIVQSSNTGDPINTTGVTQQNGYSTTEISSSNHGGYTTHQGSSATAWTTNSVTGETDSYEPHGTGTADPGTHSTSFSGATFEGYTVTTITVLGDPTPNTYTKYYRLHSLDSVCIYQRHRNLRGPSRDRHCCHDNYPERFRRKFYFLTIRREPTALAQALCTRDSKSLPRIGKLSTDCPTHRLMYSTRTAETFLTNLVLVFLIYFLRTQNNLGCLPTVIQMTTACSI